MPYLSFEDLNVWKEARRLRLLVRELTKLLPYDEKNRLTDQMIRCSRSITNQIAEGHGRKTKADEHRFCIIARGSLSELWDHVLIAKDEKYLSSEKIDELYSQIKVVEKLLNGYLSWLNRETK